MYARVSLRDQRADVDRQGARLTRWVVAAGHRIVQVEAEIGSGMNGGRSKVRRLLPDPALGMVAVQHRDRLARLGTELVEAAWRPVAGS